MLTRKGTGHMPTNVFTHAAQILFSYGILCVLTLVFHVSTSWNFFARLMSNFLIFPSSTPPIRWWGSVFPRDTLTGLACFTLLLLLTSFLHFLMSAHHEHLVASGRELARFSVLGPSLIWDIVCKEHVALLTS